MPILSLPIVCQKCVRADTSSNVRISAFNKIFEAVKMKKMR